MARFNRPGVRPAVKSPVATEATPTLVNAKGAPGFARDAKSELFLLAVTNMVGNKTFYEGDRERDARFSALTRQVAVADPAWITGFGGWLRGEANMRTASVVLAAEATAALLEAGVPGGRTLIDGALKRPDELGEFLGYWTSTFGRALPKPVKRGVADAAMRMINQRSALKYDTASHAWRFADVLELVHPKHLAPAQGDLYGYLLDVRHAKGDERPEIPASLGMLRANAELRRRVKDGEPELLLNPENLLKAGMTWEDVLSLGGQYGLPKAKLWEAIVPAMGAMALMRNLRNMDQAGVTDGETYQLVVTKLTDPEEIKRSRVFPLRLLSAHKHAPSLRWSYPLEVALRHSLANVPELPGRTLILVDRSGSMYWDRLSERSELTRADGAALFGTALALRAAKADLVQFGSRFAPVPYDKAESLLKIMGRFGDLGGTDTISAVRGSYQGHDRVVIVTDEQYGPGYRHASTPLDYVPQHVPVYTWNLAGYQAGHGPSGTANRHTFGGLSDAAFKMVPLLERGRDAAWPWE